MISLEEIKEKYLVQFFDEVAECGNGIIVGKYLVTAGHVADKPFLIAKTKDGKSLSLNKCIALRNEEKEATYSFRDYAVFELDGVESPLTLAKTDAEAGDSFTSLALNRIDGSTTNIFYERHETEAIVDSIMGNYIRCKMDLCLQRGNSGSPIIKDGQVFGVLSMGEEPEDNSEMKGRFCLFMSAKEIKKSLL